MGFGVWGVGFSSIIAWHCMDRCPAHSSFLGPALFDVPLGAGDVLAVLGGKFILGKRV